MQTASCKTFLFWIWTPIPKLIAGRLIHPVIFFVVRASNDVDLKSLCTPLKKLNIACGVNIACREYHSGTHSLYVLDKGHDGVANVRTQNSFINQKHEPVFPWEIIVLQHLKLHLVIQILCSRTRRITSYDIISGQLYVTNWMKQSIC
jgi:hypothetical protein